MIKEPLALHGGKPAVEESFAAAPRWGSEEAALLDQMVQQSSLFYWNGPQTQLLTERFRRHYPLRHIMPCSSGTAALHIAVAAAGIGPGDEVITTPLTDMGSVIGILYQQGVPVFADVNPRTYNLDPADVERKITSRTKAILAVHLAGNPCALDDLKALCDRHDLILIEDCAQAWGAEYRGNPVGTIGHIGCWSLNDYKHISCGDGGLVATNDERFGPLLQKFGDKAYDRSGTSRMPDVLAPNYRISEPQSAVGAAQMDKMRGIADACAHLGRVLNDALEEVPGILIPQVDPRDRWTAWFYLFRLDSARLSCDNREFAAALNAEGVSCGAGYLDAPLYRYPLFANHNFFNGRWPIKELGLTTMDYREVCCPAAEQVLKTSIRTVISPAMNEGYVRSIAAAIKKVAAHFRV